MASRSPTTSVARRLAALTLCAAFVAGQPNLVCGIVCAVMHHDTAEATAGSLAMHHHGMHTSHLPCHDGYQVTAHRVVPGSTAVSVAWAEHAPTPLSSPATVVRGRPRSPTTTSIILTVDPPPPRSL
jgi:hypothetical protein